MSIKPRVMVAMSGGVDSSVAALLLVESGYEVIGATLHLWTAPEVGEPITKPSRLCCSVESIDRAKRVASHLGIRHYVLDYTSFFEQSVVEPFCRDYMAGYTPNPCVRCNRVVKFGKLLDTARQLDITYLATGHYARVETDQRGISHLKRGIDHTKDQSYMLCALTRDQLNHVLFPLGELRKSEVRTYSDRLGNLMCDVPESQEICFVTDGNYRSFVSDRMPEAARPGPILDSSGREVGRHTGIAFYTIGQRKGLGIASPRPLYVTRIDPVNNAVIVGTSDEVYSSHTRVTDVNWLEHPEKMPIDATVQIRHRHTAAQARVSELDDGDLAVEFAVPQRAITPGQTAAIYRGDLVLGGGTIVNRQ
ncbi:MAG: tRNA 2-thiouridine(34) synthase MnmA [Candidatus Hydrogenedentes bacterium]|nr:tRNA 2-thiouridine(34) synthase MnmA [Candidatus Hydrogenedentota bacterium]